MRTDFAAAAKIYEQAASQVAGTGAGPRPAEGPSFADFLKQTGADAVDAMKASEQASLNALAGKADLSDIVSAVSQAEATLQTVVAIRDRVIQAYQDIMRMPI
jgi:flagellar hook-basal body complex protein FliE